MKSTPGLGKSIGFAFQLRHREFEKKNTCTCISQSSLKTYFEKHIISNALYIKLYIHYHIIGRATLPSRAITIGYSRLDVNAASDQRHFRCIVNSLVSQETKCAHAHFFLLNIKKEKDKSIYSSVINACRLAGWVSRVEFLPEANNSRTFNLQWSPKK